LSDGTTALVDVPIPSVSGASLLVETRASVVSAGTERMLVDFGKSNLLAKARSQPERVLQVLDKVRTDGLRPTIEAVRAKLDQPMPLGYCHAGIVREVGAGARRFVPGARVVTNGPHAEFVRVPWTLAAQIPDAVSFEAAAFTPLASIGLQGLRLIQPTLGETIVVYGLGLIGLLTVQLVRAAGCRAIGIDPVAERRALARQVGAEVLGDGPAADLPAAVHDLTDGVGCDAVLLTLSADAHEPMHLAAEMCRKRGRIVLVGVTGLHLRREDYFKKELSFQVSCSYGPGRYDVDHEQRGLDYPLPYVRWTEGRNFSAVLQLMAEGKLDPSILITHRFPLADVASAYTVVTSDSPGLGIVLQYPEQDGGAIAIGRTVHHTPSPLSLPGSGIVACIGAGNFASRTLVPALQAAGASLHTVVAPGGTASSIVATSGGFHRSTSDTRTVWSDAAIDTVLIATQHDSHASLVVEGLRAGKHVFVEKPLALTEEDLELIARVHAETGRLLCVGFNRRFAPLTDLARSAVQARVGPLAVVMTVNAGRLPAEHWTKDPHAGGGRIVGEGCHFIDLARHLVGHPIEGLHVTSAGAAGRDQVEDIAAIQMRFVDGSWASIHYLSSGHRGFPKERIELFWDGKTTQIDNFRMMKGWGVPGSSGWFGGTQNKGHKELIAAFMHAVRTGGPAPIEPAQLFEVSRWAIRAGQMASGLHQP